MKTISNHTKILGRYVGRIGYLCYDGRANQILAITAAQILKSKILRPDDRSKIAAKSVVVPDWLERHGAHRDVSELLGIAVVESGMTFAGSFLKGDHWGGKEINVTPHSTLGSTVTLNIGPDEQRTAIVEATNASFEMPHPTDGSWVLFSGSLRLREKNGGRLTWKGHAGTLVLDENNRPLAIIVAGTENYSFAAPLATIAEELKPLTPVDMDFVEEFEREREDSLSVPVNTVKFEKQAASKLVDAAVEAAAKGHGEVVDELTRKVGELLIP